MMYLKKPINDSRITVKILISFVLAIALSICPPLYHCSWVMPNFLVLVLIYWTIFAPDKLNMVLVFMISISVDLLLAKLFGTTALCALPVSFIANRLRDRFIRNSIVEKLLIVLLLVTVYQMIWLILQLLLDYQLNNLSYWLRIPVTVIFWPITCTILNLSSRVDKFC